MEYFNLGLECETTHKKIEFFTKALNLNPKLSDAYAKRGMLYYFQEKYDKMIQDFQSYIELVPATAEAYRMLGVGYLKAGRSKEAVSSFTRAIEMDPDLAAAYANRAEVYLSMGKYEQAINDSTEAIEIWGDPLTMSDALRTRAKVYWEIGRNTEAYADNRRSLRLDPRVPKFWKTFPPLEDLKGMGLLYLIGIAFVLVFRLKLKSPPKKE
jgi:tetratricopeptide (TPR) repeat protein